MSVSKFYCCITFNFIIFCNIVLIETLIDPLNFENSNTILKMDIFINKLLYIFLKKLSLLEFLSFLFDLLFFIKICYICPLKPAYILKKNYAFLECSIICFKELISTQFTFLN